MNNRFAGPKKHLSHLSHLSHLWASQYGPQIHCVLFVDPFRLSLGVVSTSLPGPLLKKVSSGPLSWLIESHVAPLHLWRRRLGVEVVYLPNTNLKAAEQLLQRGAEAGYTHNRYNVITQSVSSMFEKLCSLFWQTTRLWNTHHWTLHHPSSASRFAIFSACHSAFFVPHQLGMCSSNSSMIYHTHPLYATLSHTLRMHTVRSCEAEKRWLSMVNWR